MSLKLLTKQQKWSAGKAALTIMMEYKRIIRRYTVEADQLNARIDRLIAEEIEKARKRAAEEARKEAAARKKAAAKETKPAATSSSEAATAKKAAPLETYTMDKADRELSGSFVNNRGKLPIPITGPYISHQPLRSVFRRGASQCETG